MVKLDPKAQVKSDYVGGGGPAFVHPKVRCISTVKAILVIEVNRGLPM